MKTIYIYIYYLCLYHLSEVNEGQLEDASSTDLKEDIPALTLVKKQFTGRYAISSDEFTSEMVRLEIFFILQLGSCFLSFYFTID